MRQGAGASPALAQLLALIEQARAQAAPQVTITDLAHKPVLKLKEASTLTGFSYDILRDAIEKGTLKAKIVGRAWRVKRADLDAFIRKL
jgi:excisionase family DNA binding protein